MQKRIRRFLAAALCIVLLLIPLSGVKESFSVQNVEKTAMVKSVGFDVGESATVSYVQSVIDDNSAQHAQGVITAAAKSFSEAEKKAQILADKYLSISYAGHFLIGLPTAQKSIEECLSFLLASSILQLSSYLYVCEGEAVEMLKKISADAISTDEVLTNLNLAGKQEGYYAPLTVLEAAKAMQANRSFLIPVIGQSEEGENTAKKTVLVFKGYGVIKAGKLLARLNRAQSRAANLFTNRLKRTVVRCQNADITVLRSRCALRFAFSENSVQKTAARVKLTCAMYDSGNRALKDNALVRASIAETECILRAEMRSLLSLLKEKGLDPLGFCAAAQRKSFGTIALSPSALYAGDFESALQVDWNSGYPLN